MIKSFINPHGVMTCINNSGIMLTYTLSSNFQLQLYFNSEHEALHKLKIDNVQDITCYHLFDLAL